MKNQTFYQVLAAAINDLAAHGFDSPERLTTWLTRLGKAARDSLVPESSLVESLRSILNRTYTRELRVVVGKGRTLANVRPALRAELDRRILASASLITLNRDASIRRTLQRFSGWATSIPIGGSEVSSRKKAKENIRRGIAALPFEERRVIIDQGHKLSASLNEIMARDGGAIALIWHHVPERRPAYDARPEHVARDKKIFVLRDNWAMEKGLMKPGGAQYYDTVTAVAEEPYCRCSAEFLYTLDDLPKEMLTAKGKLALAEVHKQLRA